MNKIFIVLLAVCLISVHGAYVKREAPVTPASFDLQKMQEEINKYISTLSGQATVLGDQVKQALTPEELKKNFNNLVDNLSKAATSEKKA